MEEKLDTAYLNALLNKYLDTLEMLQVDIANFNDKGKYYLEHFPQRATLSRLRHLLREEMLAIEKQIKRM